MEIDFERFCRGCRYSCFHGGHWQYCTVYIDTHGVLEPEPDGRGGCANYTRGKRPKKGVRPERPKKDGGWCRPWTNGYSRYKR